MGQGIVVTGNTTSFGFSFIGGSIFSIPQIPEISLPSFLSVLGTGPSAQAAAENAAESDYRADRQVDESGDQSAPEIVVRGANQKELTTAVHAINALADSPLLAPLLDMINAQNVRIEIEFDVPERELADADGDVEYNTSENGILVEGSIIRIRVSDQITTQRDLERTLSHEIGHLVLENGQIATTARESENRAQDYENRIRDEIFDGFKAISFLEQPDIVSTVTGGTPLFGPNTFAQGTDGDNFIITPAGFTNDTINTGDGNDLIFSGIGNDFITVGDLGTKLIVSTHAQTSGYVGTIATVTIDIDIRPEDLVFTQIGTDLIITYGSGLDPLIDPNKVIITDWDGSIFAFIGTNLGSVNSNLYIRNNLSEHSQLIGSEAQTYSDPQINQFDEYSDEQNYINEIIQNSELSVSGQNSDFEEQNIDPYQTQNYEHSQPAAALYFDGSDGSYYNNFSQYFLEAF